MGGSSLCPEVWRETFGRVPGFPELLVLDSTDPAQIRSFEERINIDKTLFIISSKSGSTLEPNIFQQYFFERVKQAVGEQEAGSRFIAITDPGSKLLQAAEAQHFRSVFFGVASIGGRLVSSSPEELQISVNIVATRGGAENFWKGEMVHVPRRLVLGIQERKLSGSRSGLVATIGLAAGVSLLRAFGAFSAGSGSSGGTTATK